ncbi:MAG: biotin synthase BioB [Chthoniobacteraceae bacterium]
MLLENLQNDICHGLRLSRGEALRLLNENDPCDLWAMAGRLRVAFHGRNIEMCAILNARCGRCSEDCRWCAQSRFYNTGVATTPIVEAPQALSAAQKAARNGVNRFALVTSGRKASPADIEHLCAIYRQMREQNPGLRFCASLGLLARSELEALAQSGVSRYHCNLESAPSFFPRLCTTHTPREKMETLRHARETGMSLCSGGIIGLGEGFPERVEMAIALRKLQVDSIPINVLFPIKGTPLESMPPLPPEEVLTSVALFVILHPEATVRLAGGRILFEALMPRLLRAGVSSLIVGDMLTTEGPSIERDKALFAREGLALPVHQLRLLSLRTPHYDRHGSSC